MAKILLAEDDPSLSKRVQVLLKAQSYQVDTADSGAYALELLLNYSYDAAILDWDLPGVQGPEICKQYRNNGGNIPILFLTGKSDSRSRVTGLDAGADDYLCKPFDQEELLARVRAMLRRTAKTHSSILKVGKIQYDATSKTLMFNGLPVDATKKELALLDFFLRHPNEVFSPEALVARVWSSESEVTPDSVRPYIKRLRSKLTDEDGACSIVTVHGSGYKLVDS